jgi:uncharacterized protein (DUF1330 family)
MKIYEREWMDEYFSKVPGVIEGYQGQFVVRGGNPQTLEGQESLPDAVFIVEFPSKEQALAFWHSAEFAPLIRLRQTGSQLEAILVDAERRV